MIPARSGLQGIPGKNMKELADRPLLDDAVEAALGRGLFARVAVSTDSVEIAAVAAHCGAEVPFLRPTSVHPRVVVATARGAEERLRGAQSKTYYLRSVSCDGPSLEAERVTRYTIVTLLILSVVSACSGPASSSPTPPPPAEEPVVYRAGSGNRPWIDVYDFTRGLGYTVPAAEQPAALAWLATRLDFTEADLEIKGYNPDVRVFLYELDMTAAIDSPDLPANESAYLHFSEDTVIQYRSVGGAPFGEPIFIPGNPAPAPLSAASRIKAYIWTTPSYCFYPADDGFRAWQANRLLGTMAAYDGAFIDNHSPGIRRTLAYDLQEHVLSGGSVREYGGQDIMQPNLPGYPYSQIDAEYSADVVAWEAYSNAVVRALGKFIIINPSAYYWIDISEAEWMAAGGVCLEYVVTPTTFAADSFAGFIDTARRAAQHGVLFEMAGVWGGRGPDGYTAGNYATPYDRYKMWRLASYYIVRGYRDDPGVVLFEPSFNNENDSLAAYQFEWPDAAEVDVGSPQADAYVSLTGEGPCGAYKIYARAYSRGLVLLRPMDTPSCTDWDTPVSVPLNRTVGRLNEDGSVTPLSGSLQLRSGEAVILLYRQP